MVGTMHDMFVISIEVLCNFCCASSRECVFDPDLLLVVVLSMGCYYLLCTIFSVLWQGQLLLSLHMIREASSKPIVTGQHYLQSMKGADRTPSQDLVSWMVLDAPLEHLIAMWSPEQCFEIFGGL